MSPELKQRAKKPQWQHRKRVLTSCIPYEMSLQKEYKCQVDPYDYRSADSNINKIDRLLEWLIENYESYKLQNKQITSIASIQAWTKKIGKDIKGGNTPAPDFIQQYPDWFIDCGLQSFSKMFSAPIKSSIALYIAFRFLL